MFDLDELYQEVIMDHNRRPRNFKKLERPSHSADGYNPLCGDLVTVALNIEEDVIADVGIQVQGCAISKASASMMTESIKGKTKAEAKRVFDEFRRMVTGEADDVDAEMLGDLEILRGVSRYPARIKCATLSWHTLQASLNGSQGEVKSE